MWCSDRIGSDQGWPTAPASSLVWLMIMMLWSFFSIICAGNWIMVMIGMRQNKFAKYFIFLDHIFSCSTGSVPVVKSCCSCWPLALFIMLPLLPLEKPPLESRLCQCISGAHQSFNPYSTYSYIYIFHSKKWEMFIISTSNLLWNSLWRCSEKSLQPN